MNSWITFYREQSQNLFLKFELIDPPVLPFVPFSRARSNWIQLFQGQVSLWLAMLSSPKSWRSASSNLNFTSRMLAIHSHCTWKAPVRLYSALFQIFFGLPGMTFLSQDRGRCCQLSRIMRETPDFDPYLLVSRLESEIPRIITKVCHFL